jgi:hypothetical protein
VAKVVVLSVLRAALVATWVGACSRNLDASDVRPRGTATDAHSDTTVVSDVPRIILPPPPLIVDAGGGIPKAEPDAGTCRPPAGEFPHIQCFGADPAPYEQYLQPIDGGWTPGQCPRTGDFMRIGGERCGWLACGPLLGAAVSELPDAGEIAGDAGAECCFYVARLCGV